MKLTAVLVCIACLFLAAPVLAATANFVMSPLDGTAPLSVSFTDTSSGAIKWKWSYGDGAVDIFSGGGSGSTSHYYSSAGTYTITLTVNDAVSRSKTIIISAPPTTVPTTIPTTVPTTIETTVPTTAPTTEIPTTEPTMEEEGWTPPVEVPTETPTETPTTEVTTEIPTTVPTTIETTVPTSVPTIETLPATPEPTVTINERQFDVSGGGVGETRITFDVPTFSFRVIDADAGYNIRTQAEGNELILPTINYGGKPLSVRIAMGDMFYILRRH